jgi:hypothetical protein
VVGFGTACEVAAAEMENDHAWAQELSDRLYQVRDPPASPAPPPPPPPPPASMACVPLGCPRTAARPTVGGVVGVDGGARCARGGCCDHECGVQGITAELSHVTINGCPENRYPGNLNISFAFVEGESLLMAMKQIAVSSGSACTSASCAIACSPLCPQFARGVTGLGGGVRLSCWPAGRLPAFLPACPVYLFVFCLHDGLLLLLLLLLLGALPLITARLEPSYVLRALGVDEDLAHSSVRYGIGAPTLLITLGTLSHALLAAALHHDLHAFNSVHRRLWQRASPASSSLRAGLPGRSCAGR